MFTDEEKAVLHCLLDTTDDISENMCKGCMFDKGKFCGVDNNGNLGMLNWLSYKKSILKKLIEVNLL